MKTQDAPDIQACCEMMQSQLNWKCRQHPDGCPEAVMVYTGINYVIPIHDGGNSGIVIMFCPWCSATLGNPTVMAS